MNIFKFVGIVLLIIALLAVAIYFIGMWVLIFLVTGGIVTAPLLMNDKK